MIPKMRAAYAMCPVNSKTHEEAVKYLSEHDDKFNAASQTKKATPHEESSITVISRGNVLREDEDDKESTDGTSVAESTLVADDKNTVVWDDQHDVESLDSNNNNGCVCRDMTHFAIGYAFGASCVIVIIIMM